MRPRLLLSFALVAAALIARTEALPQSPADLRVVTYNIKHGRGMDEKVDLARTAAVIKPLNPDVVGLQEVDERATRSGSIPEAEHLGKALGLHHAFGKFMDFQGGGYGMAILVRHPIVRTEAVTLPVGNEPRVALVVETRLPDGRVISVINVHFDWVRDDSFRFAQASALTKYLDALKTPYVLIGDFNDVPTSRTLGLFRTRATEARKPAGASFTFPSDKPEREIDYVFFSPSSAFAAREVRVIDEQVASDHRPVFAILSHAR